MHAGRLLTLNANIVQFPQPLLDPGDNLECANTEQPQNPMDDTRTVSRHCPVELRSAISGRLEIKAVRRYLCLLLIDGSPANGRFVPRQFILKQL